MGANLLADRKPTQPMPHARISNETIVLGRNDGTANAKT